jgi:hypothetical protein
MIQWWSFPRRCTNLCPVDWPACCSSRGGRDAPHREVAARRTAHIKCACVVEVSIFRFYEQNKTTQRIATLLRFSLHRFSKYLKSLFSLMNKTKQPNLKAPLLGFVTSRRGFGSRAGGLARLWRNVICADYEKSELRGNGDSREIAKKAECDSRNARKAYWEDSGVVQVVLSERYISFCKLWRSEAFVSGAIEGQHRVLLGERVEVCVAVVIQSVPPPPVANTSNCQCWAHIALGNNSPVKKKGCFRVFWSRGWIAVWMLPTPLH